MAGHVFELVTSKNNPIWEQLENYRPFQTDSGEPLFSLRLAEDLSEEKLTILYAGDSEDPGMPRLRIYQSASGYYIEMAPTQAAPLCGSLALGADYTHGTLKISGGNARFAVDNALMLMYAFRTAQMNTLEMHASVVTRAGRAQMFLGVSGAGKSTHSRMWVENLHGSELLNDDNPIVRVLPDGDVRVYGSPWSGKTPCYKNASAPLAAFVSIRKAPHNKLIRQSPVEAYSSIYTSCSGFRADKEMADGIHATMEALIASVPGFVLECLPDADAAKVCCQGIETQRWTDKVIFGGTTRYLSEGLDVIMKITGSSMLPFLVEGRDSVKLHKKEDIVPGDIALAEIRPDVYVLHRVLEVDGDRVTLMGDGNLSGTESCRVADVKGVVIEIVGPDGKERKPSSGRVWKALKPFRRILLAIIRRMV